MFHDPGKGAHPELGEEQRDAIAQDYHMRDGVRKIEMRLSLAYYFIKRHNLGGVIN